MSNEWIEQLADDIRQKNHEAAQEYGRSQHYAGIVSVAGKEFFIALTMCLQENVDALRRGLQGDPTAAEMSLEAVKAGELRIARDRFPWVDARLAHNEDALLLEYAKGPGARSQAVKRQGGGAHDVGGAGTHGMSGQGAGTHSTKAQDAREPMAKDLDWGGVPRAQRVTRAFALKVDSKDRLYAEDAFADPPARYERAEELGRRITEILFGV